nr:NAD+ synthase [Kiritimatiellia bacterium]
MRIALAQINVTVGALAPNAEKIARVAREAAEAGADWVVFPELALCGYPPEDLILKPHFLHDVEEQAVRLAGEVPPDTVVVFGAPDRHGGRVFNAAFVCWGGKIVARAHKMTLPNYGVFDEKRLFAEGDRLTVIDWGGVRVGIHICEDSWNPRERSCVALGGAGLGALVNLSASPYHRGKMEERERILSGAASAARAPLCYVNLVGGQDELVFDGASFVIAPDGSVRARARAFHDDLLMVELAELPRARSAAPLGVHLVPLDAPPRPPAPSPAASARMEPRPAPAAEVYEALKLGLRDYMDKNGFQRCVVSISGGVDSALVAAIAVDALGPERVAGVTLPSRYS